MTKKLIAGVIVIASLAGSCSTTETAGGSTGTLSDGPTASTAPVVARSSTADETIPLGTAIRQDFETMWDVGDSEDVLAAARDELTRAGASALVPTRPPEDAEELQVTLSIDRTVPPNNVVVGISAKFQQDEEEAALSLNSHDARTTSYTCEERMSQEGNQSGWGVAGVRSVQGCLATNSFGITFIEWEEGSAWYHVETRMDPADALDWLTSWIVIP